MVNRIHKLSFVKMEWSLIGFAFCFLHQILSGSCSSETSTSFEEMSAKEHRPKKKGDDKDNNLDPEYAAEKQAGSPADAFGSNQHYSYPTVYQDLGRRFNGRRFVPVYPYTEKKSSETVEEPKVLKQKNENEEIIPIKASPEKVLEVAMQSAMEQASMPVSHSEAVNKEKEILRTGDYWNAVYVEDVDPKSVLRSYSKNRLVQEKHDKKPKRYRSSAPKVGSVRAEIKPGSKLYQLVSVLRQFSPRLLYVINEN